MSDIEGKAAMGSGERRGSGVSFNTDFHGFQDPETKAFLHYPCFIRTNPWLKDWS
ncbi:MAG TPA: hypothetical protein VGQ70_07265 [Candidatus Udaeobacter sp.]|jgi:hypothetical protein|nr:hypothetical protein [Candidatus Udaeobacter sp.]